MTTRTLLLGLAALSLTCTACRKGTVETYQIPKEKDPEMPAFASPATPHPGSATPAGGSGAMANTPVATTAGGGMVWSAPAAWKAKNASAMRKGSYAVGAAGEADLAITAFPGDVGGELANVNRWRGQLGLEPIEAGGLTAAVQRFSHNGLDFGVVEFVGKGDTPQRMLGAYTAHDGATWFFKLVGPDALVTAAKPEFLEFLRTVKPDHTHE